MPTVTKVALAYTILGENNLHEEYLTLSWQVLESIVPIKSLKSVKMCHGKKPKFHCVNCLGVLKVVIAKVT